ncbi:MAG: TonB family protein [Acidobacteriota bacterium]
MSTPASQPTAVSSLFLRHRSTPFASLGLALAVFLHAVVLASALLLPKLLEKPKKALEFVEVQVVPLAALGVSNPPPPDPQPRRQAPPPPEPEPSPPPPSEPVISQPRSEPPPNRQPPPPEPVRPPPPQPVQPQPVPPQPVQPQPVNATPAPQGSESGSPRGRAQFGAAVAALDNPDFTYSYYVERMVALIRSRWTRPQAPEGTETVLRFRIGKNGSVEEVTVVETSSNRAFDEAAARAVRTAAPFPPLPAGYRHDSLGVTLNVR